MTELIIAKQSGELIEQIDLSDRRRLTVGRSPNSDLAVDHPSISRHHVIFFLHGTKWYAGDLGSRRGVHDPSGRVRRTEIEHGGWVRIGSLYCWLNQPQPLRKLIQLPTLPESWFRAGVRSEYIEVRQSGEHTIDGAPGDTPEPTPASNSDAPSAAARLVVAEADGTPIAFAPLLAVEKLTIGRSTQCDLILNDQSVSRLHAVIYPSGDRWYVVDLGSSSGTKVDGRRVLRKRLRESTILDVGNVMLWAEYLDTASRPDLPDEVDVEDEETPTPDTSPSSPGNRPPPDQPTAPPALSAFLNDSAPTAPSSKDHPPA